MMDRLTPNGRFSLAVIAQALVVAVITAAATGYVSAKVLEAKVDYMVQEIIRVDSMAKETRIKLEEVQLRQSRVIGQADTIHARTEKRLGRLEQRR